MSEQEIIKEDERIAIVLIKAKDKFFILADEDFSVAAFRTGDEAINFFEDGYKAAHDRSYESSISACLNWMSFQVSVIVMTPIEIKEKLWLGKEEARGVHLSNHSGFQKCLVIGGDGDRYWEDGKKPQLIKD